MKSAIYKVYGAPEVIQIVENKKPLPKPNELLIKIKAASATRADTLMRQGTPKLGRLFLGVFKPKNTALGTGFSGTIEATGNSVTKFSTNQDVFGEVLFANGTNAEYVCVPQDAVVFLKPKNVLHTEAAPICDGFLTSYSFLSDIAKLNPGQHILINGASGSLGAAAVQLAKLMGAKVTGVCSTSKVNLVKALGADVVIDYKKEDSYKSKENYDVIYDTIGKLSYKKCKKVLEPKGLFMSPVLNANIVWRAIISPKKVKFSATGLKKQQDLKRLVNELIPLFNQNKLKTVIDKTFNLENIVEAHKYLESGRKVGNIAIIN